MNTKLRSLILLSLLAFISSFSFAQGTIDFQTSYTGGSYLGSSNATFAAGSRTMKFNYNNATNNKFYIEDATGSGGYELAVLPVAADDKLTITDNTNPAFAFSFSSFFYRDNNGTGIHILIKGFRKGVQVGGTVDFDPGPGGTNSQLVDMLTLEPAFANVDMVEITSASAGVTEFFDNFVIANAGTITPGTAPTAVTTTYGTASAPASFTIAADALLGDLTLTPPTGFELSQTAGGASGYALSGTAITVTASGAGVSVTSLTIYVRLAATTAVGTYSGNIVASAAGASSVNIATTSSAVTAAPLTITTINVSKVYGVTIAGATSSTTFTATGLQNSETATAVDIAYGTGAAAVDAAGTHTGAITMLNLAGGTFTGSNYAIYYQPADITVTPAALSITASSTTKVYGVLLTGGSGSSAFAASGLQNSETISTVTIAYTSGFTATAPVGSYPAAITPSAAVGGGGFAASNYSITYNTAGVTVTAAPLTVTAIPGSKTYGTTFTTVTGSTSFGINGLQNLETALNVTVTYSPTAGTATAAVGTYTSVIVLSGLTNGSFTASNYSIVYVPANLFVTPAALSLTASNTTKIYGTLLSGGSGSAAFTSSGLKNSETISTVTLAYSSGNTATAATGGYSSVITPSVPVGGGGFAASNYSITYNTGDLTVTAAALSITASSTTKVYGVLLTGGSGSTAFVASGLQNSETISTVTIAYTSGFTATAPVGSYPAAITPSVPVGGGGFATSNYSITYNTAGVTVTAAPLTVTAIPGSKTYGTTFTTVTGSTSFGINGLQNLETALNVTVTYSPTAGTATAAVGTYTSVIVPSGLTNGSFTASNYSIAYVPANLFVTPAPLTVAATPVAKTYGNTLSSVVNNSAFTATGLVNSETITQVTITYGTGRLGTDGVNSYAGSVTPSAPTGTASASNYSITFVSTALTVTARPITITGGLNKPYGSTANTGVSTFGFSISGLANGETISTTTTTYSAGYLATDPVGTYAGGVTPSGASGGSYTPANYTIAYVTGNVVVTPVTLTIIPAGVIKTYGVTATGTAGYTQFTSTGLQNGEIIPSVTSSFAAGAPATAAVGVYTGTAVTLSAALAAPTFTPTNYNIIYNTGPINVVPAALTLTANNVTKSYGTAITGTAGSSAFTVTGLVNSETVSTVTVAYGTGSAAAAAVGSYSGTVTPSLPVGTATASNYSITYVTGAIIVQTTPLTVTANVVSKPYGTILAQGSSAAFSSSGLKNSETIGTVSMAISIPISGTAAVGTYPASITPSAATAGSFTASNYSIAYVPAGITITTAPLTVTATDVVKTFGLTLTGSSGSTAFTSTGLQNGETIGTVTIAYGTGSASNASAGSYPGSVTASAATGGTFTTTNYSIAYVTGAILIGNPATFATGTIGAMATTYGTASTGSTFAVSGTNIITGGILITPPTGFEVSSTSPTAGFAPTVTLGSTGNVSQTNIYIRLKATVAVGAYSGTVTVSTAGTTTLTLTTSGTISAAPLTITATDATRIYGTVLLGGSGSTAFTATGLKNGETIGSIVVTYATGGGNGNTTFDPVGTYVGAITPSFAFSGTFTATNYSIGYVNGSIIVTPSTNAKLSALVVSSGTFSPTFASTTNSYSISVGNLVTAITLTPTTDNAVATVKVNGTAVTSGTVSASIPLNTGNNTITVLVTAQDGTTTNTYTITAFRERSTNANLSALAASATFTPIFASGTLAYTLSVANSVSSLVLTPTVDNSAATVTVNGTAVAGGTGKSISLSVGSNTITTIVTAEDGVTTKTYVLTVTRAASSNANLSALTISTGTLSPVFATGVTAYTVGVSNTTTTISLTPTVAEVTASVKVNGVSVTSGTSSSAIALSAGANTISIVVTAQDGTTNTYTVTVTRDSKALSTNANLSALAISAGTLSPAFAGTTTAYSLIVSDAATSLTFTPTVAEVTASVKVSGVSTVISGSNFTVALPDDINTITIAVVAEDGTTIKNYVITVSKLRTAWKGAVSGGSWTELANWTNGVPDVTKLAVIGQTNIAPVISGTVTAGSMNIAAGVTVIITGNLQVTGNVVNAGAFSGTGVVTCTGTATQTFSGTGSINNLTINNPSRVSIAPGNGNTMSLAGVLTIASGVFSTGGNLVLLSNATTTASVAAMPLSTLIDGPVTVQRWISGQRGYRIFGHPFNGSLPLNQLTDNFAISGSGGTGFVSGLGYGTASATYYDSLAATSATFQKALSNAPNTVSTPLWSVSRGIMVMIRGKGNEGLSGYTQDPTAFMADATGVLNQGALANYVLGTNATFTSFNLVGNPYAAPINIKLLKSNTGLASANTGIGNTIYVYNPFKNAGLAGSSPAQQVRGGLDAYTNDGFTDIIIPSFGGFFIQAKAVGNVLKFDESIKAVGSSPLAIMGNGDSKISRLTLQVENSMGSWDDLKLRWENNGSSLGTDNYDGLKMNNELFDFYSIATDNRQLCIDSRSNSFSDQVIPLGINTSVIDNTFRIKVTGYDMPSEVTVYLHDKLLNKEEALNAIGDSYAFALTADTATGGNNRFELVFKVAPKTTAVTTDPVTSEDVRFMPNPFKETLIIRLGGNMVSSTGITHVKLMDANGRPVKSASYAPNTSLIQLNTGDLSTGIYFVEVSNDKNTIIKKAIKQ